MKDLAEKPLKDIAGLFTDPNRRREAWETLYNRYYENMYKYIYSLSHDKDTCIDVIHDTWLAIIKKKRKLKNPLAFEAYLLRAAKNIYLNKLKKDSGELADQEKIELARSSEDVLENLLDGEKYEYLMEMIEKILAGYSEKKVEIITKYIQNPKHIGKIADTFSNKYSKSDVYKTIGRFKKDLRERFKY